MNPIRSMLAVPAFALALWALNAQATTDEAIAERIKPVGQVCVSGQECEGIEAVAVATGGASRSADDIIARHCTACHTPGLLGAPKIGDTAAWKVLADKQGGVDGILAKAIAGINAMPPRGTCGDCSDDELRGAIEKMSGL
ncbi:c-type cytochrome [Pseudomonas sp. MM211]|uniref:c-type cytochrome n=1 Tax=Pseudomonas sp. MM211 TaxID=2866808 RepID=UPI001CEE022A|nr:c-type cytochrome [Pseudomonas sp. MM211]UCJ18402.1 c-type cytochrome [Pseudomonas sp. MM211]